MVLDGVFARDAQGRPVFHAAPPPTREELDQVVRSVHRRAIAWLAREGSLVAAGAETDSQQPARQTCLDACAAIAMQCGSVRALSDGEAVDAEHDAARARRAACRPAMALSSSRASTGRLACGSMPRTTWDASAYCVTAPVPLCP
jgi:hypothetical protein